MMESQRTMINFGNVFRMEIPTMGVSIPKKSWFPDQENMTLGDFLGHIWRPPNHDFNLTKHVMVLDIISRNFQDIHNASCTNAHVTCLHVCIS